MFKEENINRKSVLVGDRLDSLSAYKGMVCQQNPLTFRAFYELINEVKPKTVIEIGTSLGGLIRYINYMCKELGLDTRTITYDIHNKGDNFNTMLKNEGIEVKIENIFTKGYTGLENDEIVDTIQSDGVTLVLCDGGNKPKEFNILSKFIKSGDIIMAHDYASDKEKYEKEIKEIYWNWHEISDSDIDNAVTENKLNPFMQDTFTKAVWVCKIKE
jgi:predicted O-methyltransferase YrrM